MLLLLYSTISLKSEYLLMAFLPRTEQRPAFSRLIDKARLTSEVLYPKSLTAKWQIMPLASLTCLFRLAEISDASFELPIIRTDRASFPHGNVVGWIEAES